MPADVRYQRLEQSPNAALYGLWTEVFSQPQSVFETAFAACSAGECPCFFAEVDGKLAASVQLFVLKIRDENGQPERVGAIGNVSTRPAYRGMGLSTELLRRAIGAMEELDCGWSFLFTGIPEFYERLGWRMQTRPVYRIECAAVPTSGEAARGIGSSAREQYDSDHAKTPLSLVRGDGDWNIKIAARLKGCAARHLDGGYVVTRPDGETMGLEEWSVPDRDPEAYRQLLSQAARHAEACDTPAVTVSAPLEESLAATLGLPAPEPVSAGMARPVRSDWSDQRLRSLFAQPRACFFRLDAF